MSKPVYCQECGMIELNLVKTSRGPWPDYVCRDCARKVDPEFDE